MTGPLTVLLVAAEPSGDALGAGLAAALKGRLGEGVRLVGVGGSRMAKEGIASPFDISELSVLGIVEGLRAYRRVVRRADEVADLADRERPDIAVLIDSWGFTLRVAQRLRRRRPGLPIVKYVGPQVWASRPGRAKTLARTVDHLLAIHAFDAPYFEREGLPVTFVGNAALARDFSDADAEAFRRSLGADDADPILLVLLGSRAGEVARLAPPFGEAVRRLRSRYPRLHVVLNVAAPVRETVEAVVAEWGEPVRLLHQPEEQRDAMVAATVALACSGTVTTELALAGAPMVVAYKVNAVTYAVLKRLARTRWITLFNIASGETIAPELIQHACTGPRLADEVASLFDDPARRSEQVRRQTAALDSMGRGGPDPSELAADVVVKIAIRGREATDGPDDHPRPSIGR